MSFRVTYSNNVEEYYRKDGKAVVFSFVVGGDTFKKAEATADAVMLKYVQIPWDMELVGIERIDLKEEECLDGL